MTADLLRQAAEKLRERAAAAPSGPWESVDNGDRLVAWRDLPDCDFIHVIEEPITPGTSRYIALMHPPVALALADLMERIYVMPQVAVMPSIQEYAEAMARAILREGPGSTSPEPGPTPLVDCPPGCVTCGENAAMAELHARAASPEPGPTKDGTDD